MNWLHSWAGVVIGGLLFAIFWMGTLSVFDREIDRWMMPMTRIAATEVPSLDAIRPLVDRLASGADQWLVTFPTDRVPTLQLSVRDKQREIRETRLVDPASGMLLEEPGTLGGTGFFFPFHYSLHVRAFDLGYWLAGFAGMAMLVMCVSGVIIHKRIFADFFTLRIVRKPQRTTLDLHNVTGVLGLPFNFMIALSGLIIFMEVFIPSPQQIAYRSASADEGKAAFTAEAFGRFEREAVGRPAGLASLDTMQVEAMRRWNGERPATVRVVNAGDAAGYVEMRRAHDKRATMHIDRLYFDAPSGRVIADLRTDKPAITVQRFFSGLHFIQFRHWTLRWLYFLGGLAGCVLIATGFLFWVQSRRKRHAKLGLRGVTIVEALAAGSTTGIIIATLGFLIANRLLPRGMAEREMAEMWVFYAVWVAAFGHAWARRRRVWVEHSWLIAAGALGAALLNALTTGDTVFASAARAQWGVMGVDIMLLVACSIATLAAVRMTDRKTPARSTGLTQAPAE